MEKSAQQYCRTDRAPTLSKYNSIMKDGWQLFIDKENTKINASRHNITNQSWHDCGLSPPFNPFCLNWNKAIATFGQLEKDMERAYEIAPIKKRRTTPVGEKYEPNKLLTVMEKSTLRHGIPPEKIKGLNDFAVAVIRGREILVKWRNDVAKTVGEGETADNAQTIIKPTGTTDPQKVAMLLVRFVPVDMATIKTGETLMKVEQQREADALTLTTTEVMQSVKLVHFDSDGKPQPTASMRLNKQNEQGEQMWTVSVDGGDPTRVPESDLLNSEKYKILSAYQDPANIGMLRNSCACKQKRIRVEKERCSEKERTRIALEKQDAAMYDNFNDINMAINSGKFEFAFLKQILMKWKKPFQCQV